MGPEAKKCIDYIDQCRTLSELAGADMYCRGKLFRSPRDDVNEVQLSIRAKAMSLADDYDTAMSEQQ